RGQGFAWPPPNVTPAHYTAEQLRQRGAEMQSYVGKRLAELVPNAMGIAPGAVTPGAGRVDGTIAFTVNGMAFNLTVSVFAPGAPGVPAPMQDCGPGGCRILRSANAALLVADSEKSAR